MNIGKLKKLSTSANTPAKMNAAIVQYHKVVAQTIHKSGIIAMFDGEVGGEEMISLKMFVGGLVTARLGQNALQSINGALQTPAAGQLKAIYDDLGSVNLQEAKLPEHVANVVNQTAIDLSSDISSLLTNVSGILDGEEGIVPDFNGNVAELDDLTDVFDEVRDMTNEAHADLIELERERIEARNAQRMGGANRMQDGNVLINP